VAYHHQTQVLWYWPVRDLNIEGTCDCRPLAQAHGRVIEHVAAEADEPTPLTHPPAAPGEREAGAYTRSHFSST
jgi:hypothetical protein